ncbi:MAG: hypothetical protein HWN67_09740 [Candidatus Helarchaeota archaeon]|nr:hypothetical protein [Candidatus Helarchaeota archaeon]
MVLRRRVPPPKKMCPRCASPMIESEGIKSCPACHYTERSGEKPKTGIKISQEVMFKPVKEDQEPKIKIFYMVQDNMVSTDNLDSDRVCLVADKIQLKIYIWKGKYTSPGEVYRAGTAATRLKTSEKMYGAQTVMVDDGEEPNDFPDITGITGLAKTLEVQEPEPEIKEPEPEEPKKKKVEFEVASLEKDGEVKTKKAEFEVEK